MKVNITGLQKSFLLLFLSACLLSSLPATLFAVSKANSDNSTSVDNNTSLTLQFEDTDSQAGFLGGTLKIFNLVGSSTPSEDLKYFLYWGENPHAKLPFVSAIAHFSHKNLPQNAQTEFVFHRIPVPSGVTHFLLFSQKNGEAEKEIASLPLLDIGLPVEIPLQLNLNNVRQTRNTLQAEVRFTRAWDERNITHYELYWGTDNESILRTQKVIARIPKKTWLKSLQAHALSPSKSSQYSVFIHEKKPQQASHLIILSANDGGVMRLGRSIQLASKQNEVSQKTYWFQTQKALKIPQNSAQNSAQKIAESTDNTSTGSLRTSDWTDRQWRVAENRSLGVALSLSGISGLAGFYSYNLNEDSQIQVLFDYTGSEVQSAYASLKLTQDGTDSASTAKSISGGNMEIQRTLLSFSYRKFIPASWTWAITEGLFYGGGLGIGSGSLSYQGNAINYNSTLDSAEITVLRHKHHAGAQGMFAFLDLGWQSVENYYIHLALQPAAYFIYKDSFDENAIPEDSGQRSFVQKRWTASQTLHRALVAIGLSF